jgi:hypothetical protein
MSQVKQKDEAKKIAYYLPPITDKEVKSVRADGYQLVDIKYAPASKDVKDNNKKEEKDEAARKEDERIERIRIEKEEAARKAANIGNPASLQLK